MRLVRRWGHRGRGTQSQAMSSEPELLAVGLFQASLGQFREVRTVPPFLDVSEDGHPESIQEVNTFVVMLSPHLGPCRGKQEPGGRGSWSELLCDHRQPWPIGPLSPADT